MPAREVSTGVTGKLAEHKFIRARNVVSETNLPARRGTTITAEAILDEEASLHAERNETTIEQHVAIQHRMTVNVTNGNSGQRHVGIYLIHPTAVQNALVPLTIVSVVAMTNSKLQRLQQRRSGDNTTHTDRGTAETEIAVDGALRLDNDPQLPVGIHRIECRTCSKIVQYCSEQLLQ